MTIKTGIITTIKRKIRHLQFVKPCPNGLSANSHHKTHNTDDSSSVRESNRMPIVDDPVMVSIY